VRELKKRTHGAMARAVDPEQVGHLNRRPDLTESGASSRGLLPALRLQRLPAREARV
jgi:hypothetical protein